MTNEDSVLEEAMDNLREAAQRIQAAQNLMHSQGMMQNEPGGLLDAMQVVVQALWRTLAKPRPPSTVYGSAWR
jgi:hypothetical protein